MKTMNRTDTRPLTSTGKAAPATSLRLTVYRYVQAWQARRATRYALGRLDPHLLRDIGLSDVEAQAEAEKPFWRD
jgi:uncharacterized protein YjiS (DUF1127 family)